MKTLTLAKFQRLGRVDAIADTRNGKILTASEITARANWWLNDLADDHTWRATKSKLLQVYRAGYRSGVKFEQAKQSNPGQLQIVVPKGTPVKLLNAPKGTRISRKTIEAEVTVRSKTTRKSKPVRNAGKKTFFIDTLTSSGAFTTKRASTLTDAKKIAIRDSAIHRRKISVYTSDSLADGYRGYAFDGEWHSKARNSGKRKNPASPMARVAKRVSKHSNPGSRYGVYVGSTLAYVSTKKLDANKAASKLKLSGRVGIKIKQVKPNPISGKLPKIGWREQYKKAAYATMKAPAKRRKQAKTTARIRRTFARRSR